MIWHFRFYINVVTNDGFIFLTWLYNTEYKVSFFCPFIDEHLECDDSLIRKGIIKYLDFCIETGITRRLMETHGKTLFPDLFSIYMDKHETIITILKNTLQLTQLLECEENYGC